MKILIVCSHGGHLMEIVELLDAFSGHEVVFVTYESDRTREFAKEYKTHLTKNIGNNPIRLLQCTLIALKILIKERPKSVVSTGSEIAIPFFYLSKLLGIKTIFIESVCRVRSSSATGRIVYPVADTFFVQWEQMLSVYGSKARYEGSVL